ncbi:MAG TPA: serine hydrolase domain-containing protein [Thermoanaerobaculia bacterium]|nr:serine hydrolase domain-containing protein [Thermoanaerobaculia bacterium]
MLALRLSAADDPLAKKVDAYLAPLVKSGELNAVVLIARGDKPVVQRAYGMASFELQKPLDAGGRFRIASITKTFTSAAILMLIERGKLALDDPLAKYAPEFPNADKITIRQLLLHRSGVPNPKLAPCSGATLGDVVADLAKQPLWFEPGKGSRYSNGGYAMLAHVIERAAGKPWETFLRDEIFTPLHLDATMRDVEEPLVPGRVAGYAAGPGALGVINTPCQNAGAAFGSGALLSTASDLHRWGRAFAQEKLFKRKGLEWPYGWGARTYHERPAIEQSGIVNGFSSYLCVYPDDDLYVVVLSNLQTGALTDLGISLAALALGKDTPPVKAAPPTVASTAEQRQKWLGRYQGEFGIFELTERNGALYNRWGDSETGSYVLATGERTAYNRQESAAMELVDGAIVITWGDGKGREFRRTDRTK